MKLRYFFVVMALLVLAVGAYFYFTPQNKTPVHFHAGFYVYVDGVLQDFSKAEFMHFESCNINTQLNKNTSSSVGKAHLHDNVGDVVHIHEKGAKWGDLFMSINYYFPVGKSIQGFKNGKAISNILKAEIHPYDSVIIVVGDTKRIDMNKYVSITHIKEVESKSESCGT